MEEETFCPYLTKAYGKKQERADAFGRFLKEHYPDAVCALDHKGDPFRLLVMALLSAQCTDKRVNAVSDALFERFPDAFSMAAATGEEIEPYIRSCGLYKTKAAHLAAMAKRLCDTYGGKVPSSYEELITLPGVGMKIAHLMLGDIFHDSRIVPDTHCIRIARKMKLIKKKDPAVCVRELARLVPKEEQSDFCHRIVLFGREYCSAPRPRCAICPMSDFCGKESR